MPNESRAVAAGLIDSLIQLESRGKLLIEQRVVNLRAQQTAFLDINSRLSNFQSAVDTFRTDSIFRKALASSSWVVATSGSRWRRSPPGGASR